MPKFKTTQQFELGGTLAAMGMPQAFTGARFFRNDRQEAISLFRR
jgi:serine protease inhibitor